VWQRYNGTTKIFEKSVDNGGSWAPLGLDAAIITQGALALARFPVSGTWALTGDLTINGAKIIVDSDNARGLQFGTVGRIRWQASGTRFELTNASASAFVDLVVKRLLVDTGTSVSSADGEIVLPNNKSLRSVNGASTDTFSLIKLNAANQLEFNCSAGSVVFTSAAVGTPAGGGIVTYLLVKVNGTNYRIPLYTF